MGSIPQLFKGLDQRFPPTQEASFKKDLEMKVVRVGAVSSALLLLVVGASTTAVISDLSNPESPWQFASGDPRTWATITKICVACLGLVNMALCSARSYLGWLDWWNWELQILATATLAMAFNAFNSSRWALLFGLRPEEVFTYNTSGDECFEMLTLDAFTTGLCIFVPIRSCVLWVAPVSGLLVHLAMRRLVGSNTSSWLDVTVLILLAFLSLTGSFWNERTARERFLAVRNVKVQEERLSNQYLAMSRILARFCDCLLELDGDFRFCGPHKDFAATIFSSANKSLDGGSFLDHLASGQNSLVEALSQNTPLDQVSDMLPLLLKDSQGREFAAQAYCTWYEDRKGRHYLIGITETQERMPQEACLMPLLDFNVPAAARTAAKKSNPSESSGSVVEELKEVSDNGEISFTFLDDDDFSIVSCSPGFTALGGPLSQEQPLRQWMRPQELQHFSDWVQELGNTLRQYRYVKEVVLSPPHTERADVEYVVLLSLSLVQMPEDLAGEVTLRVLVDEIHQRKRWRRPRKKKREPYKEKHGPLFGAMSPVVKPMALGHMNL